MTAVKERSGGTRRHAVRFGQSAPQRRETTVSHRRSGTIGAVGALVLAGLAPLATPTAAHAGPAPAAARAAAASATTDIRSRLEALPGFTVKEIKAGVPQGFRYFQLSVTQPVDHQDPSKGTFQQRVMLLHRNVSRPTVFFTSGYNVSTKPGRSEPTRIVDGNQVSMEYRFFTPSRPSHPDWKRQFTIAQAAADQHRIYTALKPIYSRNWLATGGSKGGMTATYYRYFYPNDMNGTVPYVAPNDVVNDKDVYNRFLSRVGNPTCRADLVAVQRRVLGKDRAWFANRMKQSAATNHETYRLVGSVDKALEVTAEETFFLFWQYQPATACGRVPDARTATREEIAAWFADVNPLNSFSDQQLEQFVPYYYQAARQLGWPEPFETPLRGVVKYPGADQPDTFLPAALKPVPFEPGAIPAVDRWVRQDSRRMLFVYGSLDPWSAEPFTCGADARTRDCLRFTVKGGNHGSTIRQLPAGPRALAEAKIRTWAGLNPHERPGAAAGPAFEQPMVQRRAAGM